MTPIAAWLEQIGLGKYRDAFEENAIGLDVLSELSEQDLASIGVALGDRKRIALAIRDRIERNAAPASGAERRILTVFFCDLVGSTGLAHNLDVEDLRSIIGSYQAICRSEISRYDGQVARTFGDGVLAYFGYPVVHEDDAERAANAGIAIIERIAGLHTPNDRSLQVRIGLATGPAIVEDMIDGRWADETATGQTINLAARIQESAAPGAILVDEATMAGLRRAFRCEPRGEHILKGFSNPVALWELGAPQDGKTRFEAAQDPAATPFLGRDDEISKLSALWRDATAGKGRSALLTADAGVGKSRLLHEFHRALGGVPMLVGECVSYGAQTPYLPIVSMLSRFAGIRSSDSSSRKRAALEKAIAQASAPEDIFGPLCLMFDIVASDDEIMQLDTSLRQEKIKEAVIALVCALARRAPLIVAVEDGHWIDPTSEALLNALAERARQHAFLFICTHRPGYAAPWLHASTQIRIAPLSRHESEKFIAAVLGPSPGDETVVELVAERAQGNPLFLQELTRAIGSSGHHGALPNTLHAVLMSRIDRLPRAARNLLQIASVIGREFHLRLVEQLWTSAERLEAQLNELMRLQLIYERIDADERILVFSHALIQDAAYESLLRSRRQEMHRQAAQAIEKLFPGSAPTMASVLAHHYSSGGDAANAIVYQTVAADRALQAYALSEAESLLRLALGLAQSLPLEIGADHRVSLVMRLSQTLYLAGRFDESVGVIECERDSLLAGAPTGATASCLFWLAHMLSRRARYQEAQHYARAAIDQARQLGDAATIGKAQGVLALASVLSGETPQAPDMAGQSIATLQKADEPYWLGMSEFYLGMAHIALGRHAEAIRQAESALAIADRMSDRRLAAYASFLKGWALDASGRHAQAIECCSRGLDLAPDPTSHAYCAGFLAIARLRNGELEKALPALRSACEQIVLIGFIPFEILFAAWLSEAECRAGLAQQAQATAQAAIDRAGDCPYPYGEAHARRALGNALKAAGDAGAAQEHWTAAREIFARIGAADEAGRTPG